MRLISQNRGLVMAALAVILFGAAIGGMVIYRSLSERYAEAAKLPPVFALDNTGKFAPVFAGQTPTTYNGAMGGPVGASAKCNAAFPGSHMCTIREMLGAGVTSLPATVGYAWVNCEIYFSNQSVPYTACDTTADNSVWSNGSTDYTCGQWTTNSNIGYAGPLIYYFYGNLTTGACGTLYPIDCCYSY